MDQVVTNYEANLQPIPLCLDNPTSIFNNIKMYNSAPISINFCGVIIYPPFIPLPPSQV